MGRAGPAPRLVVFACGAPGAMLRYRVRHLEEALRQVGTRTVAVSYRDGRLPTLMQQADVVVLQRVPMTVRLWEALADLRLRCPDTPVIFDIDDLIVDVDSAAGAPVLATLSPEDQRAWLAGVRRYGVTLSVCDAATVSTATIAAECERLGTPAVVVPNGPGSAQLSLSRAARARVTDGRPRVGYFSGSPTHDADWRLVSPVIAELLAVTPELRLRLVGPVERGADLRGLEHRIERVPLQPWTRLPTLLRDVDVVLAPLVPGPFSDAKSAIKWLEAGLVERPTVLSPRLGQVEAVQDRTDCLLADSPDEWHAALTSLLEDPSGARGMGTMALRAGMERFGAMTRIQAWLGAVGLASERSHVGRRPDGRAPGWVPDEPWVPRRLDPYPFEGQRRVDRGWDTVDGLAAEIATTAILARHKYRTEGLGGLADALRKRLSR